MKKPMQQIKTRDGSITFFNEEYGDFYHSKNVGAIEEAFKKYVDPISLKEGMKVFDYCFGFGYNSLALIESVNSCTIVALEKHRNVIEMIAEIKVPSRYKKYEIIKKAANLALHGKIYDDGQYKIHIIIDDKIPHKKLDFDNFDAVLFDPFSPAKVPYLWTYEIFKQMYSILNEEGVLTTYSCARKVRDAMKKAGFKIKDGPILGRRGPSTICIKSL